MSDSSTVAVMVSEAHRRADQHARRMTAALVGAFALYVATYGPALTYTSSTVSGDMSLLTMQRIKSYVDDTCTLDPHCQWTWDSVGNVLKNVSVEEAANMVPDDYMYPPGDDAEKPGQRGETIKQAWAAGFIFSRWCCKFALARCFPLQAVSKLFL